MESIQQEEIEALRGITREQESSMEEVKIELHQLKQQNINLINLIRGLIRSDKHLSLDCSLYGCTWQCRLAKKLIPNL